MTCASWPSTAAWPVRAPTRADDRTVEGGKYGTDRASCQPVKATGVRRIFSRGVEPAWAGLVVVAGGLSRPAGPPQGSSPRLPRQRPPARPGQKPYAHPGNVPTHRTVAG